MARVFRRTLCANRIKRGNRVAQVTNDHINRFGVEAVDDACQFRRNCRWVAHCAECHTPRNILSGLDRSRWMAGAPPGKDTIPDITPTALTWTKWGLVAYVKTLPPIESS